MRPRALPSTGAGAPMPTTLPLSCAATTTRPAAAAPRDERRATRGCSATRPLPRRRAAARSAPASDARRGGGAAAGALASEVVAAWRLAIAAGSERRLVWYRQQGAHKMTWQLVSAFEQCRLQEVGVLNMQWSTQNCKREPSKLSGSAARQGERDRTLLQARCEASCQLCGRETAATLLFVLRGLSQRAAGLRRPLLLA